jgi:hypothetical protein
MFLPNIYILHKDRWLVFLVWFQRWTLGLRDQVVLLPNNIWSRKLKLIHCLLPQIKSHINIAQAIGCWFQIQSRSNSVRWNNGNVTVTSSLEIVSHGYVKL